MRKIDSFVEGLIILHDAILDASFDYCVAAFKIDITLIDREKWIRLEKLGWKVDNDQITFPGWSLPDGVE